jgi:hypothetical protein
VCQVCSSNFDPTMQTHMHILISVLNNGDQDKAGERKRG